MNNISQLEANNILNNLLVKLHSFPVAKIAFELIPNLALIIIILLSLYLIRQIIKFKYIFNKDKTILELTPPSSSELESYSTDQLFSIIHALGNERTFKEKILGVKPSFALEIVSTKVNGIRYLIKCDKNKSETLRKSLIAYLPKLKISISNDYLPNILNEDQISKIIEFKLTKHFAFPLKKQSNLDQHDPIAYITGMMTKLTDNELVSFQIVATPIQGKQTKKINKLISANGNVVKYLNAPSFLKLIIYGAQLAPHTKSFSEQEVVNAIDAKINQPIFELSIKLLLSSTEKSNIHEKIQSFKSALASFNSNYQSIKIRKSLLPKNLQFKLFKNRLMMFSKKSIFSISEISSVYHFPYGKLSNTEDLIKSHSKELPAPLSLKKNKEFDVIFGKNNYGGTTTDIGLTEEERETHMYIIGRTGSGKTTMMFSMAKNDIEKHRGMAFLDPHGDVADDLLSVIPRSRINDLVYINPIDLKYPIGINLLELTEGLDEDELELEKEVVAEGVISLFRKVFSKEENVNAHRIEYILRNAIYTAFTVKDATIFTVYDLLNNPPFQKQVTSKLKDENLKNFWKFEFGRAGEYQIVKMVGGVTAKIGRFLFSPTAKRILEQPKSTINFSKLMDEKKIIICNLSQGKLGEDTSRLLGTTIMTKIQQAALKRAYIKEKDRVPFYLYVDEFQNFATHSFTKMLSEGRKYRLRVTLAEQSTSQQDDKNIVNVILANVTTVVCFRSANYIDENLMLDQLSPYVEKGDISNLPKYMFYIKISGVNPEEPFSGKTIYIPIQRDIKLVEELINSSRKNWATTFSKVIKVNNLDKNNQNKFQKPEDKYN